MLWGRWAAGRAGGRRGRRWVPIAAPGRVVRGWDHTSIRVQRWGVFPGGRAHRAAIGRGGEGESTGRQDAAGESGSSVNLAERVACGDQDRERACVVLGDVDSGLGRSPGRWPMPVPPCRLDEAGMSLTSACPTQLRSGSLQVWMRSSHPYNLGRASQSGTQERPLRGGRNARPVSPGPSGPTRGQGGDTLCQPGLVGGVAAGGAAGPAPEGRTMSPDRSGAGGVKGRRRRSRRDA